MAFVAAVRAAFGGDTSELNAAGGQAIGIVEKFKQSAVQSARDAGAALGEVGVGLLKGFIVADVASKVIGFLESIQEKARALANLSRELEVGTESLQLFDKAVTKVGGSSEQAQHVWEHARKAISELAEGGETMTKNFDKLGLKSSEFIGLRLDEALEKIAAAYVKNRDEAGAYAALTDILGARNTPALTAALVRLGQEGFGGLSEQSQNLSDKMLPATIDAFDRMGRGVSEWAGRVKNLLANMAGGILNLGQIIGTTFALWANKMDGIETDWDSVDLLQEKSNAKLREGQSETQTLKEKTKELKEVLSDADKAREADTKQLLATAEGQKKINLLATEYTQLLLSSNSSLLTEGERRAAAVEAAKVKLELDRAGAQLAKDEEKHNAELAKEYQTLLDKVTEIQRKRALEELPTEERLVELVRQRDAIQQDMASWDERSFQWMDDYVKLNERDVEIERTKLELIKEEAVAAKEKLQAALAEINARENADLKHLGDMNVSEFGGVSLAKHYSGSELSGASDAALGEIIRRAQAEIAQLEATKYSGASAGAEAATGFLTRSVVEAQIQLDIQNANTELQRRKAVTSTDYLGGLRSFNGDPLAYDQFYQQATQGLTAQQQAAQALTSINTKLGALVNGKT